MRAMPEDDVLLDGIAEKALIEAQGPLMCQFNEPGTCGGNILDFLAAYSPECLSTLKHARKVVTIEEG